MAKTDKEKIEAIQDIIKRYDKNIDTLDKIFDRAVIIAIKEILK